MSENPLTTYYQANKHQIITIMQFRWLQERAGQQCTDFRVKGRFKVKGGKEDIKKSLVAIYPTP